MTSVDQLSVHFNVTTLDLGITVFNSIQNNQKHQYRHSKTHFFDVLTSKKNVIRSITNITHSIISPTNKY